ncbi:hypothetical protein GCM10010320_81760 [Streptomyces caelestis]|nr:hypothetical protein GCM10010320_81760 [Streptomyces caelestis]
MEFVGHGLLVQTHSIDIDIDRKWWRWCPWRVFLPEGFAACRFRDQPQVLPPCYHREVTSTKKQTQVRLEEDVLAAGKAAAAARRLDFNKYVERLIIEDTTGARAAGMTAAQRLIDEHGAFLDDLEQQLDAPYADPQPGAAA